MYDYLIVGSGLFGAVFAHEMTKRGRKVLVIERREHIGGNIYTKRVEGIDVHKYGPHIFHTDKKEIWDYVNDIAYFKPVINSPIANYRGKLYPLPFNMNTFYALWGVGTPEEARAKIAEETKIFADVEPKNLEEQALKLVGKDIYKTLIKEYTEKQWGRDCRELPAFIIKRLPVRFTFDNNYFNDAFQGIPAEGYTDFAEKLLEGAEVRLGEDFFAHREKWRESAKKIVFTGMVDRFFDCKFGALKYRSLRFEEEILPRENFQGVSVMNFTSLEVPYTRITEHKHFTKQKSPVTVISREYPTPWQHGEEPYYPINDEENGAIYKKYAALAESSGVIFGGRLGTYSYLNMDKVIEQALCAVRREI